MTATGRTPKTSLHLVEGLSVARRDASAGPARTTVVLVHGAMDRAASFGRVMRRLEPYDTVAYDRRGYAGSLDGGVAETLEHHVDDLARVIDWTGAARVVVVGHSFGGRLALELAARGDRRLVSIGAYELPMPELDGSRERVGAGAIEVGRQHGAAAAAEHFYRHMVGEHTWSRLRERDREARRAEGPALLAELVALRDAAAVVDLSAVSVPVVAGVGERSAAALRSGAELLHERLADSRLVRIAGAGHGAHLTHPDEFARFTNTAVGAPGADPFGERSHRRPPAR